MKTEDIQNWLSYWHSSRMVAVENILSFDQVHQARKFCRVMRAGIFADVTDLQIWKALVELKRKVAESEGR